METCFIYNSGILRYNKKYSFEFLIIYYQPFDCLIDTENNKVYAIMSRYL